MGALGEGLGAAAAAGDGIGVGLGMMLLDELDEVVMGGGGGAVRLKYWLLKVWLSSSTLFIRKKNTSGSE